VPRIQGHAPPHLMWAPGARPFQEVAMNRTEPEVMLTFHLTG